jgi:hypothetical protein
VRIVTATAGLYGLAEPAEPAVLVGSMNDLAYFVLS